MARAKAVKKAVPPPPPQTIRQSLRQSVRAHYDMQKLRIQTGNRIVANFKALLGQEAGVKEVDLDTSARDLLKRLRTRYKRMARGIAERRKSLVSLFGHPIISDEGHADLVRSYFDLEQNEEQSAKVISRSVGNFPIWDGFLKGVKGIGPMIAAVLITEIEIARARYPSSLWKYAGLDVAGDGGGRSKREAHLVEREYTAKDGSTKMRNSITFNPFLKTKLLGVLGPSFLKANNAGYRQLYDEAKHRYATDPRHADKSKGHVHNMAMRVMVKRFLADLYNVWRPMEGLEVAPTYQEAKQGHQHKVKRKAA